MDDGRLGLPTSALRTPRKSGQRTYSTEAMVQAEDDVALALSRGRQLRVFSATAFRARPRVTAVWNQTYSQNQPNRNQIIAGPQMVGARGRSGHPGSIANGRPGRTCFEVSRLLGTAFSSWSLQAACLRPEQQQSTAHRRQKPDYKIVFVAIVFHFPDV